MEVNCYIKVRGFDGGVKVINDTIPAKEGFNHLKNEMIFAEGMPPAMTG